MITAVDTNALLALLYEDHHSDASEKQLRHAYQQGRICITPIVYAELAADGHFETQATLDEFLSDLSISLDEPSRNAVFTAGQQFHRYTLRRPDGFQCPACGAKQSVTCTECKESLAPRQHIAADFVIGGHADVDADVLISFDQAFYDTYFPSLAVNPNSSTDNLG